MRIYYVPISWHAFKTYAAEKGMDIYQFNSDGKLRTKGLYHIQNVNNYHRDLRLGYNDLTVLPLSI